MKRGEAAGYKVICLNTLRMGLAVEEVHGAGAEINHSRAVLVRRLPDRLLCYQQAV